MAVTKLIVCIYGTSKIRLVTQVGKLSVERQEQPAMHIIDFPGTLKLCGHHWEQWMEKGTDIINRKKSQLTSDSFCIFSS